jgi:hypothetical protein
VSEDDREVVSTSSDLNAQRIPGFERLLLTRPAHDAYFKTFPVPHLLICNKCGPINPEDHNHHLCDYKDCQPPHAGLFVMERVAPLCFCKRFQPTEDGVLPIEYLFAMASIFMKVCSKYTVWGVQFPATLLVMNHPDGQRCMLALYFFANTTYEELNEFFGVDAFCKEGIAAPNDDWTALMKHTGVPQGEIHGKR